jgi:hypothetical protein
MAIFKPIYLEPFNEVYEISEYGEVYSIRRGIILKTKINKMGHEFVNLNYDGLTKTLQIHRLVYEAFNEIILSKDQNIIHINGIKNDNRLENLKMCNAKERESHKRNILGLTNKRNTITHNDAQEIKKLYLNNVYTSLELSKIYKISETQINKILNSKAWAL